MKTTIRMIASFAIAIVVAFAVFAPILANATASKATSTLPPILFLPGYMGCRLFGTATEGAELPATCANANIPINQPFELMNNVSLTLLHRDCMYNLLTVNFDSTTRKYSSPYKGFSVSTQHFGRFESVEALYWSFPKVAESWGYERNRNLFGIPFDYRYMSEEGLNDVGFIQQLQEFIEKVYYLNNQQKVLLIGHSNGGPTMYTFLTSSKISQVWKDKYIAAMVGLSGNFLGQMNAIHPYVYNKDSMQQEMLCSWESSYGSMPWGDYKSVKDIPIVTTYSGQEEKEMSYTSKRDDLVSLFNSVGKVSWSDRLKTMYGVNPVDGSALPVNSMDRSAHPLVDTYCLYGSNVTTNYGYVFNGNILTEDAVEVKTMEGDGNQDILDNQFCQVWQEDNRPIAKKYYFEAEAFPNVHHMQMYSDDNVLNKVHEIVLKYSSNNL